MEKATGKDFLKFAIEIEKNGRTFYESVAKKAQNQEARSVFVQLAEREKEHEKTFRDMLDRLGRYEPAQKYPAEHFQYIRDLADSSIFTAERVNTLLSKKAIADIEAMESGIGFEKDSVLFYSEVRGMLPRQEQQVIDMIINEEKKHLSELTYMANKLRGRM
jgi:rubrerythrin